MGLLDLNPDLDPCYQECLLHVGLPSGLLVLNLRGSSCALSPKHMSSLAGRLGVQAGSSLAGLCLASATGVAGAGPRVGGVCVVVA